MAKKTISLTISVIILLSVGTKLTAQDKKYKGPATVILIHHAERLKQKNDSPYLSPLGRDRSEALVKYFTANFPEPKAIYAANFNKDGNFRSIQTVAPLANYYQSLYPNDEKKVKNLSIKTDYKADHYKQLARDILHNQDYEDATVLISWEHKNITNIAKALGVLNPPEWEKDRFDLTWIIGFDQESGKVNSFKICVQNLDLPKDKASAILKPGQDPCITQKFN
jgi:hypothetical protein